MNKLNNNNNNLQIEKFHNSNQINLVAFILKKFNNNEFLEIIIVRMINEFLFTFFPKPECFLLKTHPTMLRKLKYLSEEGGIYFHQVDRGNLIHRNFELQITHNSIEYVVDSHCKRCGDIISMIYMRNIILNDKLIYCSNDSKDLCWECNQFSYMNRDIKVITESNYGEFKYESPILFSSQNN